MGIQAKTYVALTGGPVASREIPERAEVQERIGAGHVMAAAGGLALNWKGGTAVVRRLLTRYPEVVRKDTGETGHEYTMGRTQGVWRERWCSVWCSSASGERSGSSLRRSRSRFNELDRKHFADYYLIGTLASMLVAIGTGMLVRWLLAG